MQKKKKKSKLNQPEKKKKPNKTPLSSLQSLISWFALSLQGPGMSTAHWSVLVAQLPFVIKHTQFVWILSLLGKKKSPNRNS